MHYSLDEGEAALFGALSSWVGGSRAGAAEQKLSVVALGALEGVIQMQWEKISWGQNGGLTAGPAKPSVLRGS